VAKLSARTLVLDGEVAIYDDQLRSRFDWLRDPNPAAVATPPVFMAFDLLYRDGRDVAARPLRDRRVRLEDVVAGNNLIFPVRWLAADGLEAWKEVVERGFEGYVAKDEASEYVGGATRRWLKVVPVRVSGTREGDTDIAPPLSIVDPDATVRSRFMVHAASARARAATGV
jgi:bifunctional non-homologous end joining protein LigD